MEHYCSKTYRHNSLWVSYLPLQISEQSLIDTKSNSKDLKDLQIKGDRKQESIDRSGNVGVPTLKMLNPELFKEMEKANRQMKDPIFLSVRNLKERHSY